MVCESDFVQDNSSHVPVIKEHVLLNEERVTETTLGLLQFI